MAARIFSVLYFAFFLLMPYYTTIDKTKPVPDRVVYHDKLCKMSSQRCVLCACLATPRVRGGRWRGSGVCRIDPDNINSLQRGAANFMNYCSGCHSAQYVRYNTIGKDLDLSEEQLVDNLMFNAEKTFETIQAAMPAADAARWYGKAPPDLSLMARAKGADYVYNFLKGFYVRAGSPTGVDNACWRAPACRTCCGNCRAIRQHTSWTIIMKTVP